jgi:hypothetical protein
MSNDGHNSVSLDAVWMDMLRSLAILAVVIHHWLLFKPYAVVYAGYHWTLRSFPFLSAHLGETWSFTAPCDFRADCIWFNSSLHRTGLPREPSIGTIFVLRYRVFSWHVHWISNSLLSKAAGSARGFKNVLIFVLARFISPLIKLNIIRERLAKV